MVGFTGFDFLNVASNLELRRECGGVNDGFNGFRRTFFYMFVALFCDFHLVRANFVYTLTVIAGLAETIS